MKKSSCLSKSLAIILSAVMLCGLFGGVTAGADNATLEEALALAKPELYGMYSDQSAKYLRDCYDRAAALLASGGTDSGEAAALTAAVGALSPLEVYERSPLQGFSALTADDISAMKYIMGSAVPEENGITLTGSGTLCYTNIVDDGIAGVSPFAVDMSDCDGLVLHITVDAPATLDIILCGGGKYYYLSDIAVSGEKDYLFPFDRFVGGELPLDGSLAGVSFTFKGASEASFGDLHAAKNTAEAGLTTKTYSETKKTAPSFDEDKYYKIYQKGTKQAFTITEDTGNGNYVLADAVDGDPCQEWQIMRDSVNTTRFRLVNRNNGQALYINTQGASPSLAMITPNLTETNQEWSFTYSGTKGFSIAVSGVARLSYTVDRVRSSLITTAAKYFDIYELPSDDWNLVWSEEFNDGELDTSVWSTRTGKFRPDREPIYHRDGPENLYFEDGNLVIRTEVEEYEGIPATGAYIDTVGKYLVTYGKIELRAKLPEGNHIWPACWMMGTTTLGWPACGELDIIEMVGTGEDTGWRGDSSPIATVHCAQEDGYNYTQGGTREGMMLTKAKLSEDYHIYTVEWDADVIRWFWDGILFFSMPIDTEQEAYSFNNNPMYLIINTSIDGTADNILPAGTPYESFYYVDYLRYYKKTNEAEHVPDLPVETVDSFAVHEHSWETENVLMLSADKSKVIVSGQNLDVKVYDFQSGELLGAYETPFENAIWSGAVTPDGSKWVFIEQHGDIYVYESDMSSYVKLDTGPSAGTYCAITPDSRYLVTAGRPLSGVDREYAKKIHAYDLTDGSTVLSDEHLSYTRGLTMASDGKFAVTATDGVVWLYRPDLTQIAKLDGNDGDLVGVVEFSADGSRVATCDTKGGIVIWDTETCEIINRFRCAGVCDILSAAFSPDGERIAVGCSDFCVRLFDTSNGRLVSRMTGAQESIITVRYSPDGRLIGAASTDGKLRIYDTRGAIKCVLISTYNGTGNMDKFEFSADSSLIAAEMFISRESTIGFWRLPGDMLPQQGSIDGFDELMVLPQRDLYTEESFGVYLDALRALTVVAGNAYSSQGVLDAAVHAVNTAAENLTEAPHGMLGDMDGDERITVADALAALRVAARIVDATPEAIASGDTDGDGAITVADALAILRVAARITDSL